MDNQNNVYLLDDNVSGGKLIAGIYQEEPEWGGKEYLKFSLKNIYLDVYLIDIIEKVTKHIKKGHKIITYGKNKEIYIFMTCFMRRLNKWSLEESLSSIEEIYMERFGKKLKLRKNDYRQMERYLPPENVLLICERTSHHEFDEILKVEMRKIPPYSTANYVLCNGTMDDTIYSLMPDKIKLNIFDSIDDIIRDDVDVIFVFSYQIDFVPTKMKMFINSFIQKKKKVFLFDTKIKEILNFFIN